MTQTNDPKITQLSDDFKAFQVELREMRREYDAKALEIQREFDDKIAKSNDKYNTEMNNLSRENTKFARAIIFSAAVVSVFAPVIKEIAPFVTEIIKASIVK
jgi:hypothetical protein